MRCGSGDRQKGVKFIKKKTKGLDKKIMRVNDRYRNKMLSYRRETALQGAL